MRKTLEHSSRFTFHVSRFTFLLALGMILMGSTMAGAQSVIKVDSKQDWEKWRFPKGVLQIGDDGWVRLTEMRKHINASLNAEEFTWTYRGKERTGGATAGSNAQDALYIMDGDTTTSWSPDADALDADRWILLDLGRISLSDTLRMVFDRSLEPFQDFQVYATDGIPIVGTAMMDYQLIWMTRSPYEEYVFEHVFEPDPNLSARAVQCIKIFFPKPAKGVERSGLAELAIHTLGDNVLLDTIKRGGSIVSGSTQASATRLFDGNLFDFWISPLYGTDWNKATSTNPVAGAWFRLDLGCVFWLDAFELLQISNSRVGGAATDVNGFKMYTSDGTPSSEKGNVACWQPEGRDVIWDFLADVRNTDAPPKLGFELTCETRRVRYIFFHHFYGTGTYRSRSNTGGKIFEFLAYGQGAVPGVTMISNILDMGARKNITSVSWEGDVPFGTKLQIRTRTGDRTGEVTHWYHVDGTEVVEAVYNRLPKFLKGPIETEITPVDSLWSDWSAPYSASGASFASPSPRQYLLCEVQLQSNDPAVVPSLDALMFHYTAPSASELAGEIGPWKEIPPASPQSFSFYIKSVWASGCSGFDRILLVSPSPAEGTAVWRQNASDSTWANENATFRSSGDSLFVEFSRVLRSEAVKLDFETTVFYNGSPFAAFVGHSSTPWAWQRVDTGNATDEVEGRSARVFLASLPAHEELIGNISIAPDVITPNGDGVNDRMDVIFSVFKVNQERGVTAQLYDLGGLPVRKIGDWRGASRNYETSWDGRNEEGDPVSPGLYLLRIEVDGDAGNKTVSKVVSVVY